MPRNAPRPTAAVNGHAAEPAAPAAHVIDLYGVYSVEDAIKIFRLKKSTIRREIREGRLRVSKRAGRYFILGEWIIEWLRSGELPRRRGAAVGANDHGGT